MKRCVHICIVLLLALLAPALADSGFLQSERVGTLRVGMSRADVVTAVGNPSRRGAETRDDDGAYSQLWEYKRLGLAILMRAPRRGGEQTAATITVESPSKLATARDVRVGSSEADVRKAYASDIDNDASSSDMVVAGSLKGCVVFTLERDRVVRIFLGSLTR